jgi:hypothetical protein
MKLSLELDDKHNKNVLQITFTREHIEIGRRNRTMKVLQTIPSSRDLRKLRLRINTYSQIT